MLTLMFWYVKSVGNNLAFGGVDPTIHFLEGDAVVVSRIFLLPVPSPVAEIQS